VLKSYSKRHYRRAHLIDNPLNCHSLKWRSWLCERHELVMLLLVLLLLVVLLVLVLLVLLLLQRRR
jgi:Tfp pilus assembly protein PilN